MVVTLILTPIGCVVTKPSRTVVPALLQLMVSRGTVWSALEFCKVGPC